MKTTSFFSLFVAMILATAVASAAQPSVNSSARVGVYDSRAVAFAHFWSEPASHERDALIARAKAAKDAGDSAQFKTLQAQIGALQKQSHLEVFSTAPADEAMAAIKDKLPAIQRELGVERLVSKWNGPALEGVPEANRVDATDRLVREFLPSPTEKQQKTIESLKAAKPLSLWKAKLMNLVGAI